MASKQVLELIAAAHRDRATKLDLSGQYLTELPDSVCEIKSLVQLDLSNNKLVFLPESIGNLYRLTQLYLQSNDISELPESVGKLTKLRVLVIHKNPLTKLPESIGNLTEITTLRPCKSGRQKNTINSLPESIGNLVNLKRLHVNGCQLTTLPKSIGNLTRLNQLSLVRNQITSLPESIGELSSLKELDLSDNKIAELPKSISKLTNLFKLKLDKNLIVDLSILQSLPKLKHVFCFPGGELHRRYWIKFSEWKSEWILDERSQYIRYLIVEQLGVDRIFSDLANIPIPFRLNLDRSLPTEYLKGIGDLRNLTNLTVRCNDLTALTDEIKKLVNLKSLEVGGNKLLSFSDSIFALNKLEELRAERNIIIELPETIGNLTELITLGLSHNHIQRLPASMANLINLRFLDLNLNPIDDLSILQHLPALQEVWLFGVRLPRRYWTKFSDWKAEWLLDEQNAEIRRRLIEYIGYEKICDKLGAIEIDSWNEYTLLKIDNIQIVYERWREVGREPMVLLKMTCPSTAHIHILRVPPDMTSAEDAIVWVNHGIHPSKFAIQT